MMMFRLAAAVVALTSVTAASSCFDGTNLVFHDVHDGDYKRVTVTGSTLQIKPAKNNQTWEVTTHVDARFCNASIDFRVPGKPSPPPCAITGTFWELKTLASDHNKLALIFTDPTGQIDKDPTEPINIWVANKL